MFFTTWEKIGPVKQKTILSVVISVLLAYASVIYFAADTLSYNRISAEQNHAARMNPNGSEGGRTAPEPLPAEGDFTNVKIGAYVENIDTFSIRDSFWSANFYVWFSWKGAKELDPGGKLVVVDGTINKKELLEQYSGPDGQNYQKYRVSAKFIKFFDTTRVPIEGHMLNIYLEDGARDATKLRYVADTGSNISSRAKISGYKITGNSTVVKPHSYRTSYGDPRLESDHKKTYSQFIFAVEIQRANVGVYLKIFISLFAALALALSNFFVKPTDVGPRFSLPSAAYFGAVANSYVANSILPPSGSFGLVDYIAAVGMGTIFLTIALSLTSNYLAAKKNDADMAYVLDRSMFYTLAACCIAANIIIPVAAFG
jgi:hypothetical protein